MRMRVQSLASFSRLWIQCYHQLQCSSQMWFRTGITMAVVYAGNCSSNDSTFLAQERPCAAGVFLKIKIKKKRTGLASCLLVMYLCNGMGSFSMPFIYLFIFAAPTACRNSGARDQTRNTAVTQAATVTM